MSTTAASMHVDTAPPRRPPVQRTATPVAPLMRPRIVLSILSLLLVLIGAGWLMLELGRHPISSVRIAAEFRQLDRSELETVVQGHLGTSFFAVDVDAVRRAARALPWVREASVRRVWPGSIHIAIVEREAVYRWNQTGLLEADGTLFEPVERVGFERLPQLFGPPTTHAEVVALHGRLQALMAQLGQSVDVIELSARGAWRAELSSGIELVLGREPGQAVLRRLARAYPAVVAGQQERIQAINLRYANGFAVRWKPLAHDAPPGSENQG